MSAIILLDIFSPLDIKSGILKTVVYYSAFPLAALALFLKIQNNALRGFKLVSLTGLVLLVAIVVLAGPLRVLFSISPYKTQNVLFEHKSLPFTRIEHQVQDIGAFGYKKRLVKATYITPLFMWVHQIDTTDISKSDWLYVDKFVNELGLKDG